MNSQELKKLENHIVELREMSLKHELDLMEVLNNLEQKANEIKSHLHENMDIWDKIKLSRIQQRPTTLDFIHHIFEDFIELHGDRLYGDDPALVSGIATFEGVPITIIGNQKGKNTKDNIYRRFGMSQPEGYRKALRIMQQANKFNRPIVTFINTPGAFPGREAEERGQSEAIARNLREMASFGVPIICIVIGEGGSGGALALGIGNRIFMLENTFYSVISPEGAAALLWKDATQAKRAAEVLKISAKDLLELGVIDEIIKKPVGGAHIDLPLQSQYIKASLRKALQELGSLDNGMIRQQRFDKFRKIGVYMEEKLD
ncbi:acetyl-CoA carboxylase carboxyltransferase subunit alpha [Peribacillus muralis]|uniref:acetyl-CoA carboxylase carboxyltransferase subunit alpha n=1 Tax=Peribacillus muralis TaxID=264697 RepID=UPI001F4D5098|nr:acetyl-CoA carboxylase carboxyltransferase subunit alpha [Peribacillus muralis]MCK2011734.1 acetyl-CoA carboxylase carboxyltransferase subunit alpha [Peribacillus muralis]